MTYNEAETRYFLIDPVLREKGYNAHQWLKLENPAPVEPTGPRGRRRRGSGIGKILNLCSLADIPEPHFEEYQSGFFVEFKKDIYTEEYLRKLGLNERQTKAAFYVKKRGRITNKEYQELTGVSKSTATTDLRDIVQKEIFYKLGVTGRGTEYILK